MKRFLLVLALLSPSFAYWPKGSLQDGYPKYCDVDSECGHTWCGDFCESGLGPYIEYNGPSSWAYVYSDCYVADRDGFSFCLYKKNEDGQCNSGYSERVIGIWCQNRRQFNPNNIVQECANINGTWNDVTKQCEISTKPPLDNSVCNTDRANCEAQGGKASMIARYAADSTSSECYGYCDLCDPSAPFGISPTSGIGMALERVHNGGYCCDLGQSPPSSVGACYNNVTGSSPPSFSSLVGGNGNFKCELNGYEVNVVDGAISNVPKGCATRSSSSSVPSSSSSSSVPGSSSSSNLECFGNGCPSSSSESEEGSSSSSEEELPTSSSSEEGGITPPPQEGSRDTIDIGNSEDWEYDYTDYLDTLIKWQKYIQYSISDASYNEHLDQLENQRLLAEIVSNGSSIETSISNASSGIQNKLNTLNIGLNGIGQEIAKGHKSNDSLLSEIIKELDGMGEGGQTDTISAELERDIGHYIDSIGSLSFTDFQELGEGPVDTSLLHVKRYVDGIMSDDGALGQYRQQLGQYMNDFDFGTSSTGYPSIFTRTYEIDFGFTKVQISNLGRYLITPIGGTSIALWDLCKAFLRLLVSISCAFYLFRIVTSGGKE